jgi:multiple sugar transport system permease protein
VGIKYYQLVFRNKIFLRSLINNIIYLVLFVFAGLAVSLVLAAMIHKTLGFVKKLFIAMYFAPVVTSLAAVSLIWKLMYYPKVGLFSVFFSGVFGIQPQTFLQDARIALYCIILMDMWKSIGLETVILLAGIEEIPDSYFDASRIDGASSFQQFFRLTVPLLRPQIFFLIVIKSIYSLKTFVPVFMMTTIPQGGPMNSTKVLALHLYQQTFERQSFGYGAVVSVVIFILLLFFVIMQIKYYRSEVE